MRAIWTGAIGFGLVNIPVKMYSATEDSTLDLDMLDKHDNANIRFARINEQTGEEVAWGDIVKGYKVNNQYVVLTEDDLEAAAPKKAQAIEIEEFVDEQEVDSPYYEAPFYLAPDKGGDKGYALLREALSDTGKAAIGTYVMRGKEHLCMLKAEEDALVLIRLRFAEEIRSTAGLELPAKTAVKPSELKVAKALIEQLTAKDFSIKKYKDTYHAALLKLIDAKAKGQHTAPPKLKIVRSSAKDLMAQLKASLGSDVPKRKAS
jgi:DNA end-binding protein Ku